MFLPVLPQKSSISLDELNDAFNKWLAEQYNLNTHRGINDTPMDRYLNDIMNVTIRKITPNEADQNFYHTIYRRVKNDSTITVNNMLYEAPVKYIGKKIEIRFPLDDPIDLRIFENNRQCHKLTKLDKHFNSEMKIKYSKEEDQNV